MRVVASKLVECMLRSIEIQAAADSLGEYSTPALLLERLDIAKARSRILQRIRSIFKHRSRYMRVVHICGGST